MGLAEGKRLYSLDAGGIIHSLYFSPNMYWLYAATQESIKTWDLESKSIVQNLKPTDATPEKNQMVCCTSLSWSCGGSTLFTGYTDASEVAEGGDMKSWADDEGNRECNPNGQNNRQCLADCGIDFGANASGGKGGQIHLVTDSSDHDPENPTPGMLRHAVIQTEPLWIIFSGDGATSAPGLSTGLVVGALVDGVRLAVGLGDVGVPEADDGLTVLPSVELAKGPWLDGQGRRL